MNNHDLPFFPGMLVRVRRRNGKHVIAKVTAIDNNEQLLEIAYYGKKHFFGHRVLLTKTVYFHEAAPVSIPDQNNVRKGISLCCLM